MGFPAKFNVDVLLFRARLCNLPISTGGAYCFVLVFVVSGAVRRCQLFHVGLIIDAGIDKHQIDHILGYLII